MNQVILFLIVLLSSTAFVTYSQDVITTTTTTAPQAPPAQPPSTAAPQSTAPPPPQPTTAIPSTTTPVPITTAATVTTPVVTPAPSSTTSTTPGTTTTASEPLILNGEDSSLYGPYGDYGYPSLVSYGSDYVPNADVRIETGVDGEGANQKRSLGNILGMLVGGGGGMGSSYGGQSYGASSYGDPSSDRSGGGGSYGSGYGQANYAKGLGYGTGYGVGESMSTGFDLGKLLQLVGSGLRNIVTLKSTLFRALSSAGAGFGGGGGASTSYDSGYGSGSGYSSGSYGGASSGGSGFSLKSFGLGLGVGALKGAIIGKKVGFLKGLILAKLKQALMNSQASQGGYPSGYSTYATQGSYDNSGYGQGGSYGTEYRASAGDAYYGNGDSYKGDTGDTSGYGSASYGTSGTSSGGYSGGSGTSGASSGSSSGSYGDGYDVDRSYNGGIYAQPEGSPSTSFGGFGVGAVLGALNGYKTGITKGLVYSDIYGVGSQSYGSNRRPIFGPDVYAGDTNTKGKAAATPAVRR